MGGGGSLVVTGCEVKIVDVKVDDVDIDDVEVVDAKIDVVEVVDVVGVEMFSCGTPSIWVTRDCTWLVGVVVVTTSGSVTGFVVGSSASWVMCASGEQATPGSEQGSATL